MISVDDAETNRKFAESLSADFPILSDPGKDVPYASRWTYYIGPDGKILHIDKQVSAASHGEEVAARLKTLGVAPRP
jgi:peroxiredoxin Q/BCP